MKQEWQLLYKGTTQIQRELLFLSLQAADVRVGEYTRNHSYTEHPEVEELSMLYYPPAGVARAYVYSFHSKVAKLVDYEDVMNDLREYLMKDVQ